MSTCGDPGRTTSLPEAAHGWTDTGPTGLETTTGVSCPLSGWDTPRAGGMRSDPRRADVIGAGRSGCRRPCLLVPAAGSVTAGRLRTERARRGRPGAAPTPGQRTGRRSAPSRSRRTVVIDSHLITGGWSRPSVRPTGASVCRPRTRPRIGATVTWLTHGSFSTGVSSSTGRRWSSAAQWIGPTRRGQPGASSARSRSPPRPRPGHPAGAPRRPARSGSAAPARPSAGRTSVTG